MTAFTLLMICIVAQILIAGGLGVYLFRRFRHGRKEGEAEAPSHPIPPRDKNNPPS
jgi:hypothetical protein